MSSVLAFSETNKNRLPQWIGQFRSGAFATIAGGALVYMALRYFIPADTLSTALFFDGLKLRHAVEGNTSVFAPWNSAPVSNEGLYFSVFVSLANIALAYLTVFSGDWIVDKEGANIIEAIEILWRGGWRRVNTTKVGYFLTLIVITVFETATGGAFRATGDGFLSWITGVLYAMVVENLASDFALTGGVGMFFGGMLQMYDALTSDAATTDIRKIRNHGRGEPATQPASQPKPQPVQAQNPRLPQKQAHPQRQEQRPQQPSQKQGRPSNGHAPAFVAPVPTDHTGYRVVVDEEPPDFIMPHLGGAPRQ